MTPRWAIGERGLTLPEMLIAMIIFSAVVGGALNFLRRESRGLFQATERMNALQNVRYAADVLEQDLRTAGIGVLDQQPFLVYAGPAVVAFNADYASNVKNDVFAVYYDPDAPEGSVSALTKWQRIPLPLTSVAYPDTTYLTPGGSNSAAETIVFFFATDSTTPRPDDFLLLRQVNQQRPELVARNLLAPPGGAFFEYWRLVIPANAASRIDAVPVGQLPLRHVSRIHLSPADTGTVAVVDSIRGVRVTLSGTNGLAGPDERRRTVVRMIRLPNAGLATRHTCGDEPLLGTGLAVAQGTLPTGEPVVNLAWNQSTDEAGGEKDVVRYVIWRRQAANMDWGDPYLSIPAGNPTYAYSDAAVGSGDTYFYALAAQDCTPSLSTLTTSGPVTIP